MAGENYNQSGDLRSIRESVAALAAGVGIVQITYNTTPPALANGASGPLQGDDKSNLRVLATGVNSSGFDGVSNSTNSGWLLNRTADGTSSANKMALSVYNYVFNGTSWDRMRGTVDGAFVLPKGNPGTLTDKSGTITVGATAQNAIASNAARNGFMIQNQSSGDLYFSTLATAIAGQPSIKIVPGQSYETPLNGFGTGAVSIIGATTGQAFAAREW